MLQNHILKKPFTPHINLHKQGLTDVRRLISWLSVSSVFSLFLSVHNNNFKTLTSLQPSSHSRPATPIIIILYTKYTNKPHQTIKTFNPLPNPLFCSVPFFFPNQKIKKSPPSSPDQIQSSSSPPPPISIIITKSSRPKQTEKERESALRRYALIGTVHNTYQNLSVH